MALVAGITISIPLLLTLNLLNKYQKGLLDITYILLGKKIGTVFAIFAFVFYLEATSVSSRNYVDITHSLYLPRTPQLVVYSILIGGACIIAYLGIEAMGRVAWIVTPYVFFILLIAIISSWKEMRFEYIFPLLGAGIKPIVSGGVTYSGIFIELITFSILFGNVRGYKEYKLASGLVIFLSVLLMCVFAIAYIAVFDYPSVTVLNFVYQTFVRFIHIGRYFTNLDALYLIFWVFSSIIRYASHIYLTTVCLKTFLKADFKKLLLIVSVLCIILGSIPENAFTVVEVRQFVIIVGTLIFPSMILILYIVSKIKKIQ